MTAKLFQNPDGADSQSRAVLAYLSNHDGIENSWCKERKDYLANPYIARFENCREQGYVITMRSKLRQEQINIIFFQHRNVDTVCVVKFEGVFLNSPTINNIPDTHPWMSDKWEVDFKADYGQELKVADYIYGELEDFWARTA